MDAENEVVPVGVEVVSAIPEPESGYNTGLSLAVTPPGAARLLQRMPRLLTLRQRVRAVWRAYREGGDCRPPRRDGAPRPIRGRRLAADVRRQLRVLPGADAEALVQALEQQHRDVMELAVVIERASSDWAERTTNQRRTAKARQARRKKANAPDWQAWAQERRQLAAVYGKERSLLIVKAKLREEMGHEYHERYLREKLKLG